MGKKGAGLAVDELNFLQNRLGLGKGFDPFSFTTGANAGVFAQPQDEATLRAQLLQKFTGGGATGGNEDIIAKLLGVQGKAAGMPELADLDPAAKAALEAITNANMAKFTTTQDAERVQLLNDLFGSGTEKSTIALDKAGRSLFGQGANLAQLLSDAAQRELQVREFGTQSGLQNFGLQANILQQAGGLGLSAQAQQQQLLESLIAGATQRQQFGTGVDLQRQQLLSGLGQQVAGQQAQRKGSVGTILSTALSLGSSLLPGGGTLGGTLLSKIPGLSSIFRAPSSGESMTM